MKCELCENRVRDGDVLFPLGWYSALEEGIVPDTRGVHLDCIKEMLEALRAATLAMAPSTEHQAPTGESNGT